MGPVATATIMRRLFRGLTLALGCLPLLAAEPRLHLFIWSEYLDPEVVREFERRFQCRVVLDLFEDDGAMMAKLQAGGASYDLVVPPDHRVPALIQLKLLAPLRHERLPNLRHLEARFRRLPYDPDNRYTVPYQWGTLGLLARPRAGQPAPDSWAAVFDPRQQPGPFVLLDSPRDLIAAALRYRGRGANVTDPVELRAVRDLLLETKRRALGFDSTVGGKNKVLARQASLAVVYSGEGARAMAEDPETVYVLPREGSLIWVDHLAVLSRAPRRDLAEQFINFCLEPEIGARISNFTRFATPNAAARSHLRPADRDSPVIYPPEDVLKKLEFLEPAGAHTRLYDEIWTYVKAR